ncbi:MAG: beta strand repeat-containing protein, partial [Dolichospermum sp.]
MPNTLRVKRGLAATLPNGASGEPLFTTDTYELYIGKGDGTNQRYQKYIASGTTSQYLRGDGSLETHNLDSLTDVIVSTPSNGQVLQYNGTNWVNATSGYITGSGTAAGQVAVFSSLTNVAGYTTFTYDTVTDKLSMTNAYVNNNLTVDGQLVIKSESGASAYTRGLKFPDNSYGGAGDIAGLRLHNAGGENIILELYAGNDSLDTINFAVAAGGSTYNDNVTINGNKIWNAGNLPSPLSSTGSITSGEIAIFSNSTTVYSDTALFWDNTLNRLGIGGNSPNAQVGVSTSSGVNAFGYKTSGASYYEMVLVYDNTTYGHLFQTGRGASTSARNITFLNASSTVSIDESGNMGIGLIAPNPGTSGPGGLGLDIYASTTAALALHNATSGTGISAGGRIYYNSTNMTIRNLSTGNMTMTVDNGNFTVITLGAENIKVEGSSGKVGIGAPASIAEMLTVNGSIQQSAVTSSMLKANASGKIIAAVSNTDFQAPITLTTTGTSGAATFNGTTLNIPQYQGVLTNPVTGTGTNNEIAYFNATGSTIASLSTATYPSLTELSYVKGVTSAIQTQLNGKQNTLTNPVTGTGTSGYHAKFTATGSTIGNSLIYDNGVRAISVGNSSTNPWASPFYVIEGGTYGQFIGFQTNNPAFKLGTNSYFNGSNYIYTNTGYGVSILDIGSDATNAYLDFYGAPTGTAGNAATISKKFSIDNTGNAYFVESLGVGFTSGTINGRIDFRNAGNAIIVGKNTTGGTNTYSSIRLTTANSGGVGDSIGEIRGLSTNVNNRDTALTFLTSEGSAGQTEKMRITAGGNVGIGETSPSSKLHVVGSSLTNTFRVTDAANYTICMGYEGTGNIGLISTLGATASLALGTNQTARMTITGGGNVGIGTSSPAQALSIGDGTSTKYVRVQGSVADSYFGSDSVGTFLGNNSNAALYFQVNSTERMRITSGGTVLVNATVQAGYGGTFPKLEVVQTSISNTDGDGGTLSLYGNSSAAQDTGAALVLGQAYSGTTTATGARVRSGKENSTSGNFASYLALDTRANGGNLTERMRITSGGLFKFQNNGSSYES